MYVNGREGIGGWVRPESKAHFCERQTDSKVSKVSKAGVIGHDDCTQVLQSYVHNDKKADKEERLHVV